MKSRPVFYTVILFSFAIAACQKADPNAAMLAKNKEVMQNILAALSDKNLDALDKLIDPNYIEHSPDPWMKGTGLPALKESMKMSYAMYPDLKLKVNYLVAEGDIVMAQFTWSGTNTGSVEGMPATGKAVNIDGVDVARFKDGMGVEHWGYFDMDKMMGQLGFTWAPAAAQGTPAHQ